MFALRLTPATTRRPSWAPLATPPPLPPPPPVPCPTRPRPPPTPQPQCSPTPTSRTMPPCLDLPDTWAGPMQHLGRWQRVAVPWQVPPPLSMPICLSITPPWEGFLGRECRSSVSSTVSQYLTSCRLWARGWGGRGWSSSRPGWSSTSSPASRRSSSTWVQATGRKPNHRCQLLPTSLSSIPI